MKILVGIVKSNTDVDKLGTLKVAFPDHANNEPVRVTYTSPFYRANAGGMIALPEVGTQVMCAYNEFPKCGEESIYYLNSIINQPKETGNRSNENFEPIRTGDSKAKVYSDDTYAPVTQTFTNGAGAGLIIHREYSTSKISNNVTLKSESGDEITAGYRGIQIANNQGDHITLNNSKGTNYHAPRSLSVETINQQQYKCTNSDILWKIKDGGDYLIENNSTGAYAIGGTKYGNIRLKSRERNIDLAALGSDSHVNIITQGATIQVNGEGKVTIVTSEDLNIQANNINMTATNDLNIVANGTAQVGGSILDLRGQSILHNNNQMIYNTGAGGTAANPEIGSLSPVSRTDPSIVRNDYDDPIGSI
jgi:hypothetical protein